MCFNHRFTTIWWSTYLPIGSMVKPHGFSPSPGGGRWWEGGQRSGGGGGWHQEGDAMFGASAWLPWGKQDFNGTKTYKKTTWLGESRSIGNGLLPIFGRGCGDNRRFMLARPSHTMNWNEISSWARQRLGRLGSWWSQADVLIKSAEDQLPYGCGVACKVWRHMLTTWFGSSTPPWSASSSSALVHMGPHGILPCCLNF